MPDSTPSFTLICANDETVSVDSGLLSSTSMVFRDMLQAGSGERECRIAESADEIKLLLAALQEGQGPGGDKAWYTLYRLMDKYEVPVLKGLLLAESWHRSTFDHLSSYSAAILLGQRELAQLAATGGLKWTFHEDQFLFNQIPEVDRNRLLTFRQAHVERATALLDRVVIRQFLHPVSHAPATSARQVSERAVEAVKRDLFPDSDPSDAMRERIEEAISRGLDCPWRTAKLYMKLDELIQRWHRSSQGRSTIRLVW